MKTILVPTDGSEPAEKALRLALDLAEKHGADVKLFHVLLRDKEPAEIMRLPELEDASDAIFNALKQLQSGPRAERSAEALMRERTLPDRPAPEDLLREIGEHVLRRASAIAAERGVRAEVLNLADGWAAPAIARAVRESGADTIVMGMRGLRQIEAVAYGSVSQDVVQTVDCTCVAVH